MTLNFTAGPCSSIRLSTELVIQWFDPGLGTNFSVTFICDMWTDTPSPTYVA